MWGKFAFITVLLHWAFCQHEGKRVDQEKIMGKLETARWTYDPANAVLVEYLHIEAQCHWIGIW